MERERAVEALNSLVGVDLRHLADKLEIRVWTPEGKKNKGWAGHTLERFLGLPINSAQSPNFGSWELKQVLLVPRKKTGLLRVKETMKITSIDAYNVTVTDFEDSHLLAKMRKIVAAARIFESPQDSHSLLHSVATFDLGDTEVYEQVKADYNLVRETIKVKGFESLSGSLGVMVQPRTSGKGHGSKTRSFYARTQFVAHILGEGYSIPLPVTASSDTQKDE
jgi:DNA mismatch repair protein MutH